MILQHVKERFHAFNTARIVKRSLQNCELIVKQTDQLAALPLPLLSATGVLYPGEDSQPLGSLTLDERPEQLIIIDGTWHHAKTLMRDVPTLQRLPRFCLQPERPSNYRIRKEPTESALSTVEATVEALRYLEPDTSGFDQLLAAFSRMVDDQVAHPERKRRIRKRHSSPRPTINVPGVLLKGLDGVVVAYGETSFGERGKRPRDQSLIYWVAQRLGTGESFEMAINTGKPLEHDSLAHLELSEDDFDAGRTKSEFRDAWREFIDETDVVCTFNESTRKALIRAHADFCPSLSLKSVNIDQPRGTLDEILSDLSLTPPPVQQKGRAGRRLANAIAYTRYLNGLARGSTNTGHDGEFELM